MRNLNIVAAAAVLTVALVGSSALAAERTTGSATFIAPYSQAYVGTFVQDCSGLGTNNKSVYVGVYLGQAFQVEGKATLSIETNNKIAFSTSPRMFGEEGWLSEIGGQSRTGCLPIGSKVFLLSNPGTPNLPIMVLGIGIVK